MINKTFYPTPKHLIGKMIARIRNKDAKTILEPSAGKGDIIDYFHEHYKYRFTDIFAIENDETLQATLRGKNVKLIDSDFLLYAGADKFDVIIANPPFDEGDKHLLRAIDIMYNGEIIFLLNAETLKNPYTNTRKQLVRKLEELAAKIDYVKDAFLDAERKTKVEIALVYIKIENNVEDDLFADIDDIAKTADSEKITTDNEIQTLSKIKNMVDDYNRVVAIGQDTLMSYYKNYRHIGHFIHLENQKHKSHYSDETLTELMQEKLNNFLKEIRKYYWEKVLTLDDVSKRLTAKKQDEFYQKLQNQAYMDFTENNIRQFIINLMGGYEQTLIEAVVKLFDDFTENYAWDDKNEFEKNIHYFNGWKTNKAFFVNKKVILPYFDFTSWGKWKVDYRDIQKLHDIDLVMSYFDASNHYLSITDALNSAFSRGQNRKVLSTYFEISAFKKGTIHLTFLDENIQRRFNITACKGKGWLPQDYGHKPYEQLPHDKRELVKSFEGEKSYTENIGDCSFKIQPPSQKLLN